MRRSRETSIIRDEFGVVVGVTLKADFTAEHEWGIQELKTALGVDDSKLGIDGRLINDAQFMYLLKGKKGMYLYVLGHTYSGIDVSMLDQSSELHCLRDETLSSAWSGRDMCVYAKNPEDVSALEQIYHRAKDKDVAIGLGGSDPRNPFDRQGLSLMIVSRMLPDVLQEVYDGDLDYQNLQIADKDTGLGEALNKKYRGDNPLDNWFNRPKIRAQWASGHHETRGDTPIAECTKYPVVYWLSTNGSERYYGWYTVEEINQWLDTGKGIIEDEKNERDEQYASR